jgi:peptidoglycan/xylan/chitin deacetylase (PgdA/CDA1 family)
MIVETNRERIDASGRLYPALHVEPGRLKRVEKKGALCPADGDWREDAVQDYLEFRIPWSLLNVTDPSSRSVLDDSAGSRELEVSRTDGIVLTALSLTGGDVPRVADAIPEPSRKGGGYTFENSNAALFTWQGWEEARYTERRKASFREISSCFLSPAGAPGVSAKASVALWPGNRPGAVSVSFDDGTLNQEGNALPVLERLGIKATFGLCGAWTDSERKKVELMPGCVREQLSAADARKLMRLGHEIASHGYRHVFLDTLPEKKLGPELRAAKSSLEAATGAGVEIFHYPFSRLNEHVMQEVRSAGFLGARSIGGVNPPSPDRYLLKSVPVASDVQPTLEQLRGLLEETRQNNGWLILTYHNVLPRASSEARCYKRLDPREPYFITPSTFRSQMRLLKASGLYVAPEGEVLRYVLARDNVRLSVAEEGDEVRIKVNSVSAEVNYVTRLTLMVELPWTRARVRVRPGDSEYRVATVAGGVLTLEAAPGGEISIRRME